MELDAWDYALPESHIATRPADPRDSSRLMVMPLPEGEPRHAVFRDLPSFLRAGDLLVVNDTRVWPARLFGNRKTGGRVELLVLHESAEGVRALARPARKLKPGDVLLLDGGDVVRVSAIGESPGEVLLRLTGPLAEILERNGTVPLPPYLGRPADAADTERYQTVYASVSGSAAAPTAGLHFTPSLLDQLQAAGVGVSRVTLHVGPGTFRPLTNADLESGVLHPESWSVPPETAAAVVSCRSRGGRVVAVGTTTVRTLESATPVGRRAPEPGSGTTQLFVRPPYTFRSVDGMITNFHLPKSSLLMLVASLCGRERLFAAYASAIGAGYRFYSYGDAMLLLPD